MMMSKTDNYESLVKDRVLSVFDMFTSFSTQVTGIPLVFKNEYYEKGYRSYRMVGIVI